MGVTFSLRDLVLLSPALSLFLASLVPITIKVLRGNREPSVNVPLLYTFLGVGGAVFMSLWESHYFMAAPVTAFSGMLKIDGLTGLAGVLIGLLILFTVFYLKEATGTAREQLSEQVFLLLNCAIGMWLLVSANHLILTFVGIELMSLALYLLVAMGVGDRLPKEAAFKYFVLGSFASAIFLYGTALIYGSLGSLSLPILQTEIPRVLAGDRLLLAGVALAVVGFCFKVAVVPFHAWAPDVYEGAPTPLTALMATGVKFVSFIAFLRFVLAGDFAGEASGGLLNALQWLAVLTMLLGNIAAIWQVRLKRLLAYSSVAHSGYLLVALIAAGTASDGGTTGAAGVVYYGFAYVVMSFGAFGAVALFEHKAERAVEIRHLRGLVGRDPWVAAFFAVFMLSLAGIPPTVGFFAKLQVFSAAVDQGFWWLAFWGVMSSVIGVFYYLRPVVAMFLESAEPNSEEGIQPLQLGFTRFAIAFTAALVVLFGIVVEPVQSFIVQSVAELTRR